jgi:hypothetical protein
MVVVAMVAIATARMPIIAGADHDWCGLANHIGRLIDNDWGLINNLRLLIDNLRCLINDLWSLINHLRLRVNHLGWVVGPTNGNGAINPRGYDSSNVQ